MVLKVDVDWQQHDFNLRAKVSIPGAGVTALYGPSGAGKTSLLRILAGLEKSAKQSTVELGSASWQGQGKFIPPEHRGVGFVFQDERLFPHLTVEGNLDFAWQRRHRNNGPDIAHLGKWLGLSNLFERYPDQLSGGQKQRVSIARALAGAPHLLLLDEPLSGLDSEARESTLALLETLHRELDIPMVYVSHQIDELMRLADHVIVLEDGRVTAEGGIEAMTNSLDSPLARESGAGSVIHAQIIGRDGDFGLTSLDMGGGIKLFIGQVKAKLGTVLRLRIPADAVSLARTAATDSSILNILPATVNSIRELDTTHALVELKSGDQQLLAKITRKSVDRLALENGLELYAQVKGVALLSDRG